MNKEFVAKKKDIVTKEYVDSKVAFYDGVVNRSTNSDTTNCWVKIAECEAPNNTSQIMDEITLYPCTTDSSVKTMCKVRAEGKGRDNNTWKLHIIDSTKDFNSNNVKLIYDRNIVDNKRKIELWGYNTRGWDGFYSQKTFGNTSTLTLGLKCLTSRNKFKTTYLHDDFIEAPTIDISIKSLVDENVTSVKNDIALNRTTLGYQCKNLLKNNAVTTTVNGITFTVNDDGSVTVNGTNTSSSIDTTLEICGFKNYGTGKFTASLNSTDSNLYMSVFDNSWVGIGFVYDSEITWDNDNKERYIRLVVRPGATINNVTVYPMIRYADIIDDTYEPYQPSLQERINNFGTKQTRLYTLSLANPVSSAYATYTGLFINYSSVICIIGYSDGLKSIVLPLKYIKSLGTSTAYFPEKDLEFKYVDDDTLSIKDIASSGATLGCLEIIGLY